MTEKLPISATLERKCPDG